MPQASGQPRDGHADPESHRADEAPDDRLLELMRSNAELDSIAEKIAHDLREPLRGIKLITEFLLEDAPGLDSQIASRIGRLGELASRTGLLVKALREHARAGHGPLMARVDLAALVGEEADAYRARNPGVPDEIVVQGDLPGVIGDRLLLGRVIGSLIDNGLRYNRAHQKRVDVGATAEGGAITVFVRDNGIGIDPTRQAGMFRLYSRMHDPAEFGAGAGAALAIARKIIEQHGGRMWVESAPGRGSTFFFSVPSAPP